MAATVEELYRNYGILADAKDDLSQVSGIRECVIACLWFGRKQIHVAIFVNA